MEIVLLDREEKRIADLDYALVIEPDEIEDLYGDCRFIFEYPASEPEAGDLVRGNKIAITDIRGNWQLYEIIADDLIVNRNQQTIKIETEAVFNELRHKEFVHVTQATVGATLALEAALLNTAWDVGTVEVTVNRSIDSGMVPPFEALRQIANIWEGELRFRVTVADHGITGRYVDLLLRRGVFRGKAFEMGYDLEGINILFNLENVKTALYGWGTGEAFDEETGEIERLDFSGIEWVKGEPAPLYPGGPTSPAPANKPLGQLWVGCEEARGNYGSWDPDEQEFEHRFGEYESQAKSPEALLWETWRQVVKSRDPLVNIRASVFALQQVEGFDHERVDLGDTNYIILEDFAGPIEARVIKIERKRKSPDQTRIELANYRLAGSGHITELIRMVKDAQGHQGIWDRAAVIDPDGKISTSVLDGIIDAVNNQIKGAGGTVWIDETGFWIIDSDTTPDQALAAIRGIAHEGEAALLLGTRDTVLDPWEWKAGMTSSGIADEGFTIYGEQIIGGTILADIVRIEGDSKFYWDGSNIFCIDPDDPNKQIRFGKYDGVNYGLGFTLDGGTNWNIVLDYNGLRIGPANNFEQGYDPSLKETPEGAQAKADSAESSAKSYTDALQAALGGMAWEDVVEKAKLGTTIIEGGYIVTDLLHADRIVVGTIIDDVIGSADTWHAKETPAGAQAKADDAYNSAVGYTDNQITILEGSLGGMAYEDLVEVAKLGSTIISGGYIVTGLVHAGRIDTGILNADRIGAGSITADKINVTNLTAITANFTELKAGGANDYTRLYNSEGLPYIDMFSGGYRRVQISRDRINFYRDTGAAAGTVMGTFISGIGACIRITGSLHISDYLWIADECYVGGQRIIMPQSVGPICRWATIVSTGRSMAFVYSDDDYNLGAGVRWYGSQDSTFPARSYHSSGGLHTLRLQDTNLHVYGTISQGSSMEIKKNIEKVDRKKMLDSLKQIEVVEYEQKTDNKNHIGVIAEEVEKILPRLVCREIDPAEEDEFGEGKKIETKESIGLNLGDYISVVVASVQELADRIEKLENGGMENG